MNLPDFLKIASKNVVKTQADPQELCFFSIQLKVHFQIDFCQHLTFHKQVTAIYYNIMPGVCQRKTGVFLQYISCTDCPKSSK